MNSGKDYKHLSRGSIPVYGTGGYMLSVDKELSNVDAIGIGRKGTIDHPQYLKAPFWTVDTLFFMTPKNDINIDFAFGLSQTINWKKYDESTGLPSLSKKSIDNISIKLPNYNEQIKIGRIISQIDNVISLQQRKLKLIKVELSAILQQLLSQKSTWPNYKLSQVVSIQDNKRVPVKRQDRISGPIPYYGANGVQDYVDGYTHKGDLILIAEDGANSLTNYPIYFVNGKIWANNHTHVLRPNKEVNPLFLTVTLKQINYSKCVVGGSRYKLNLEDLKSIKLNIPNRVQQDKIGGIYNKFYQVQLKENHKLKLLHKIKHFLLQNMFI
nr:restriction endonuclease subunit S [Lactobacillus amylovorus]